MDQEQLITKPSKYDRANLFGRLYCTWVYSTFIKGLKREVTVNDVYKCPKSDESEEVVVRLERNWNKERTKKSPSLFTAIIKTFALQMIPAFCIILFVEAFMLNVRPLMLGYVIKYFNNPEAHDFQTTCLCAAGVVVCALLYVMSWHPTTVSTGHLSYKIKVSLCTLIYKKALKLNSSAFKKTTIGQILNLISNDISRLEDWGFFVPYIVVSPIQAAIGMYICWQYIGWHCLIGIAIILMFIPFNSFMGKMFFNIRTKVASLSDNRFRLMNEIIKGMAVIKMYAWERHFSALISDARKKEMSHMRRSTLLKGLQFAISLVSGRMILYGMYLSYVLNGGQLTAEHVFVTMAIINAFIHNLNARFPQSIALTSEIYVSCKRIQKYLLLEEIVGKKDNSFRNISLNSKEKVNENKSTGSVDVRDITAKWCPDSEITTLNGITVSVRPGELLAVIGTVGSGKSSFLMSLLNEIPVTSGSVRVDGDIAYASQETFCFNATILENILFGKQFDSKKWKEVISVCAMERDLKLWDYGEKTLVGERGVQLSGGQKARITLARALYNDADIYLLDDPLSAVDSEVAKHIFKKCIKEYLKSKTVVLVTHQIQFIKAATNILVLKEGQPMALGSYEELCEKGIDFMALIEEKKKEKENKSLETLEELDFNEEFAKDFKSQISITSEKSENESDINEQKILEETKESGAIDSWVYWYYIKAGAGPVLITLAFGSWLFSQTIGHYIDLWLTNWTNNEDKRNTSEPYDQSENVITYSSLILIYFIALVIRSATVLMMCITSSINLHNRIFYRLMRAPIVFFDTNPIGRILNRFTKDVGVVDEELPISLFDLTIIFSELIGMVIVISIVNWYLIFPALFVVYIILQIRWIYVKTARELKRIENMSRSPVVNHMTTTLNGLTTIRAFRAEDMFRQQYYRFQNDNTAMYWIAYCSSRGLGVFLDTISVCYIACVAVFLMLFYENIPGSSSGLALTLALGMTGLIQWTIGISTEVENQMTSVERILEYSRLESEAELESVIKPAIHWPQEGRIVFKDVYLTYENSPKPTLLGLNCEIRPGEKVGIVGRTGAGKSSILSALFRMHEIDGNIIIDDIDCKTIGLHDLRKRMSIIPQDPIAFIGSLRKNLDPFDEHSEDRLWSVLEEVELKDAVNEMPEKLDYQLSESGGNLSVGQRQLICLARAILRRNRILVLDEATANVDHKTDSLIQTTIRHNFTDSTVLTIAHRLNTIIDSDRVLVLDAGRIVEFDIPYVLLQNSTGMFTKLVSQTGETMASQLMSCAKQSYHKINANVKQY